MIHDDDGYVIIAIKKLIRWHNSVRSDNFYYKHGDNKCDFFSFFLLVIFVVNDDGGDADDDD